MLASSMNEWHLVQVLALGSPFGNGFRCKREGAEMWRGAVPAAFLVALLALGACGCMVPTPLRRRDAAGALVDMKQDLATGELARALAGVRAPARGGAGAGASVTVTPGDIAPDGNVTLSWSGCGAASSNDYVAVYSPADSSDDDLLDTVSVTRGGDGCGGGGGGVRAPSCVAICCACALRSWSRACNLSQYLFVCLRRAPCDPPPPIVASLHAVCVIAVRACVRGDFGVTR